jgi:hypothetical protein
MESQRGHEYANRTIGIIGSSYFYVALPTEYAISLGIGNGDHVRVTQRERRLLVGKA